MNTAPCLPTPVPLYRPWLRRMLDDLRARWHSRRTLAAPVEPTAADYQSLAGLSEDTLRDIGAPDWLHERDRGVSLWMLERARW